MPRSRGRWGITPEWAMVGRVPSAASIARFTARSRIVLFHVGSCWDASALAPNWRRALRIGERVGIQVEPHGLVVPAPHRDRRVVAEQVDHLAGLAHGLLADLAGVAPLEREVLPQQHPGLVGGVVELGPGHVGVDPEQVETGLLGEDACRVGSSAGLASASAMRGRALVARP